MTALVRWIEEALLNRQTWTLEAFLSAQALAWGAWVLSPLSDVFQSIPGAYSALAVVPEWCVGLAFTVHGIGHAVALWSRDVHLCRRAALAAAVLWSIVFASFLATIPLATSTPMYGASMGASLWVYLRLHLRFAHE